MRIRVGGLCKPTIDGRTWEAVAAFLSRELGVYVDHYLPTFFEDAEIRDFLDGLTLIYKLLETRDPNGAKLWFLEVTRILKEESAGYRIDEKAGLHPLVDFEFETLRVATIQVLAGQRYKATLATFEGAHEALERDPPDTKEAVRDVFGAVENLFKLMTAGQASRLVKFEIEKHVPPMLDQKYKDVTARTAAGKMVESLIGWVAAGHCYRHEPGTPEPAPPPMDYAIMTMGTGAGFLRWLAEIDRALNP